MPNDHTKNAIKAAFIHLLNERPLNKISVKSIVDSCNISRNTFYYHYQDIPTLLEEIIKEAAADLTRQHDTALSMESCVEKAYAFVKENKRAVYHIYNSIDRGAYEDFLMRMCDHTARLLVDETLSGRDMAPDDKNALTYFVKCQFFGLCMDWTKSGMDGDIAETYHRAVRLLTELSDKM